MRNLTDGEKVLVHGSDGKSKDCSGGNLGWQLQRASTRGDSGGSSNEVCRGSGILRHISFHFEMRVFFALRDTNSTRPCV
jgi:hypothetical protein